MAASEEEARGVARSNSKLRRCDGFRRRDSNRRSIKVDRVDDNGNSEEQTTLNGDGGNDTTCSSQNEAAAPIADDSHSNTDRNSRLDNESDETSHPEVSDQPEPGGKIRAPSEADDSDSDEDAWFDCFSDLSDESSDESEYEDAIGDALSPTEPQEDAISTPPTPVITAEEQAEAKRKRRIYNISQELLTTEQAYVDRLEILRKVKEKVSVFLPEETVKGIFKDVHVIHQFHSENLLPQLKKRLAEWDDTARIGDIMKRFAPFLKLYTEYVKNFEKASDLVQQWKTKSSEFLILTRDIQEKDEYAKVRLEAHMLEPIQRVPRYELMLKDYIKHLAEDATDREDAQEALSLVAKAAQHFEEMMRRASRVEKLQQLQSRLDGEVNIVKGSRELLKEGKINKVNIRSGGTSERYLFLFTDMLLVCSEQSLSARYRVRQVMDIQGLRVSEGNNLEVPNTFYIRNRQSALELCTPTEEEKVEWIQVIRDRIGETTRNRLMRHGSVRVRGGTVKSLRLGRQAPVMARNSDSVTCTVCGSEFTTLRRRHHCRACGIVVCGKCSSQSVRLEYDSSKPLRVCDECFVVLQEPEKSSNGNQPRALSGGLKSGYMRMSSDAGRTWRRYWFVVHSGGTLMAHQGPQNKQSQTFLRLEEFSLETRPHPDNGCDVISLRGQNKSYLLQTSEQEELRSWHQVLQKATSTSSRPLSDVKET